MKTTFLGKHETFCHVDLLSAPIGQSDGIEPAVTFLSQDKKSHHGSGKVVETTGQTMDQLGAILAKVVRNNQQLTEGWAQQVKSQFAYGEEALDWGKESVIDVGNGEITAELMSSGWTDLARINRHNCKLLWCFLS